MKKEKFLKDEIDVDILLSQEKNESESEILSKIPVSSKPIKVKTIKKHSKDPLKEFVKVLNADGSWEKTEVEKTESPSKKVVKMSFEEKSNSKIPVFINESSKVSSPSESQKEMCDSDSDTDSRQSPPLRGILKKSSMRTLGSSSGSDIALHEAGGELSDDDTGKLTSTFF